MKGFKANYCIENEDTTTLRKAIRFSRKCGAAMSKA